jgi:hypothetical protein
MGTNRRNFPALPKGEQPVVEWMSAGPVVADTFAGRIHVERDGSARVTPLGQLPFFIEYLKQGGLFDGWGADCPLHYRSPNAPNIAAPASQLNRGRSRRRRPDLRISNPPRGSSAGR